MVNLHCPQAWLSSCLGERLSSDVHLIPLLQLDLLIHHSLTVNKAPKGVPPQLEGLGPRSGHPLANPSQHQRDLIQWATPTGRSMWKCWISSNDIGATPWCPVARWQCSLTSYLRASVNPKPFAWFIGRHWHSSYPMLNRKQQEGGPLNPQFPDFTSKTTWFLQLPPTSKSWDSRRPWP